MVISFGYPTTDTCSMCDQFELQLSTADDTTRPLMAQQKEIHLHKAETFYNTVRSDTRLTKQSKQIATISFDFEQNLPLQSLPVGEVFYMDQLWLYVLGVHNCGIMVSECSAGRRL